jgi:hypothetical protein
VLAVVIAVLPMFTQTTGAAPAAAQAGLADGLLVLCAATLTLGVVLVVRTSLDILIWLSPFPVVDLLFQIVKLVLTALLIALALLAPIAALVVNLLLVIVGLLLLRWSLRAARFGLVLVWDLSLGRFWPLPALPAVDEPLHRIGPLLAFALEGEGVSKRQRVALFYEEGLWSMSTRGRDDGADKLAVGTREQATLRRRLLGLELALPDRLVLLPPRYLRFREQLAACVGGELEVSPAAGAAAPARL